MRYLICPYTAQHGTPHERHSVQAARARIATAVAAAMSRTECDVYSPLTSLPPLALHMPDLCDDHAFWMRRCLTMLRRCDTAAVLRLPDWEHSAGCRIEISTARELGIPLTYTSPQDWLREPWPKELELDWLLLINHHMGRLTLPASDHAVEEAA
jgi:hypothetical protein